MQFAAVFVEYLVTGVVAIVWILPLLGVGLKELDSLQPGHVTKARA